MAVATDTNIVSIDALLSAFITFAVANAGFADEGTVPITLNAPETLRKISRTTNTVTTYWGFVSNSIAADTSYDKEKAECRMMLVNPTAANWATLDDGQRWFTYSGFWGYAPPYTGYKFYSDGTNVFAAIEVRVGIFTHFAIGNLEKCGTYDGGEFLQGDRHNGSGSTFTSLNAGVSGNSLVFSPEASTSIGASAGGNYVRFNAGGNDHLDFFRMGSRDNADNVSGSGSLAPGYTVSRTGNGQVLTSATTSRLDIFGSIVRFSPSSTTNVAPIMPIYVTRADAILEKQRIIGFVPNIGCVSIANLNAKDIVNTDWEVYPKCKKTGDNTSTTSDFWGIAYKAIP